MMFNIIKESFKITNDNIIIATPLILFSLISSLYLFFSLSGGRISLIFSAILFFLMTGAFLSGWFYIIKQAIKEKDYRENNLIAEFPTGVGEYFLITLVMIIKVIIVSLLIFIIAFLVGKKFIGMPGITYTQISQASVSVDTMKALLDSLSNEQLIKINAWNILLFCTVLFNYFIFMFYPAAVFFKKKNPFIAFLIALKDVFGHKFFSNVVLYIMIFLLYTIISCLSFLFGKIMVVHFMLTLINFYFMTFIGVLIFNYYYSNFAKIGSHIDELV